MYIKNRHSQLRFSDFQQPIGLKMNPENRWIKKAEAIPWAEIEERYNIISENHECSTDSDAINKMMMKFFSSIDPDMVIQIGEFMKRMEKD